MTTTQIKESLSGANKGIVDFIEQYVPVKFTQNDEDCYACQMHRDCKSDNIIEAEIFYKEPLDQLKLAHELLHIKTDLLLGDNKPLYLYAMTNNVLSTILDEECCTDIINFTQHVAFAQDIINMGYSIEQQFEVEDMSDMHSMYNFLIRSGLKRQGQYDLTKIQCYIKLLFAFLFYPNAERFISEIDSLKKVDYPLFMIVKQIRDKFDNIAIKENKKEYVQNAYMEFGHRLNNWIVQNDIP